ncbi:malectin domain-containing carbohydrate-binding protein, partial [Christiangramia echinicola]|uniref:malectin domain-containing carbohydrate-binding protein n=1 Tax=Christiangramia echinicola TaxID=279359 RepID=UPI000687A73F
MFNFYNSKWKYSIVLWVLVASVIFCEKAISQSFSQNAIDFNGFGTLGNGTSLAYGPDSRLYVTEYTGGIKIYTIERDGPGDYKAVDLEVINDIQNIQDHNDDGTLYSNNLRETIGLAVTGTPSNPVFYVSSSDFRIGGTGNDTNLDTNSGIITRFTWNGTSWDVVDIVRGLPRSEENHATNGLEFTTVNGVDYLIVAQGGHTNAGAPSHNFAYTSEYALSAAVLSINLNEISSMPILDDNGRKYIYDIPTLDDPTRSNINGIEDPDEVGYDGIDINDPFGGNDGLNQAMIVPGGPVQIFSPGYRNTFDLVVTEKGAVYVTDNGANGGWGGFPVNEGGGNATNDYDPNEPGSTSSIDGEQVNNVDHLNMVTNNINNYNFGSFYGGHPTPVRANPIGAGLYTNPSGGDRTGALWRNLIYHPTKNEPGYTQDPDIGLPANWPPVPVSEANPVEGDWRGPGINNPDGSNDDIIVTWGTNTNAIDEYTASNFDGAMQGDLLAGVNYGVIRRVELNEDGSLQNFTSEFISGLGGNALGVSCNGDSEIFPGTIWVVTLEGDLIVMEPQDFGTCIEPGEPGYDPLADNDFDGYSNQDEVDNGTLPCNGGSQPRDFDKAVGGAFVSDLNDPDDDSDGILDENDSFQLGDISNSGSDAFTIPVINELFSSNGELKGYLGLGMTGMMNNGDPNPNWLNWIDRRDDPNDPNPNDILGGAIGAMTMQMTSGTAYGTSNSQEKAFQYGIQTDVNTGVFTVSGAILNFDAPLQLYGNTSAPSGELGFFIGDGTQSNYIKFVLTPNGFIGEQEIEDVPGTQLTIPISERPASVANFYFIIDPVSGEVQLEYSLDNGSRISLGTIMASGSILDVIQQAGSDLAVGFIGTSNASGVEVEGTWDFLNVTFSTPVLVSEIPDLDRNVGDSSDSINLEDYFLDDEGLENLTYTVQSNSDPSIDATIAGNILNLTYPSSEAEATITIRATDNDNNFVEDTFTVFLTELPLVLYRINAGGPGIASIDGDLDWAQDNAEVPSVYLTEPGTGSIYSGTIVNYTSDVDQSTTPVSVFDTERYDGESGIPNLNYSFPVSETGYYEVRLYMGNGYDGTAGTGTRVFDVAIENIIYSELDDVDLSDTYGHQTGTMISQVVNVNDSSIDISFIHGIQNPLINAIEILNYDGPVDTPIQVSSIPDQVNSLNEELDGSLVVLASGGDGNLSYSMEGAPPGVTIEPTNGQIGGTINASADISNPYTVTINVDDNDENVNDIASTIFTWTIVGNTPVLATEIPDLERIVGDVGDDLDLDEYFLDDQGVENLTYTIESNTDTSINTEITGNILSLIYPSDPAESTITIRATDEDSNFVEDTFTVFLSDPLVLFRVNTGGPAVTSIDEEIDWAEDSASSPSEFLMEAGNGAIYSGNINSYSDEVDQGSVPVSIFQTERYDGVSSSPHLTYSFPISVQGNYEVRLYMGNGYDGTAATGTRIFDVSINDVIYPELNNVDLSDTYGHQTGTMISQVINVTDGYIDISFIHGVENPLINGIEIMKYSSVDQPIVLEALVNQAGYIGEVMDGSIFVRASGGDGPLDFSMVGAPPGISIDPLTGIMEGTISNSANVSIPYSVTVTVDDFDADPNDTESIIFNWTVSEDPPSLWSIKDEDKNYTPRHECSFVQAGDKFYLIGGRENANTLDVYDYSSNTWVSLSDSAPKEFNHYQATEYQGLIWVIGAFQTNSFPNELPAEYIWAFDPATEEWIQVIEIPADRQRGSAGLTIYNDKFYISGGNTIGHNGGFVSWFDEFDPATGIWTSLADAPRARDHFHSAVIDDKLYLAGGRLSGGTGGTFKPVIPEVDVYDFTTNTWSTLSSDQNLPTPRAAAATVNFNGKLVVIGGEVENELVYGDLTSDALKITEQYDPATGIWNRLADMNFERHGTQGIVSGEGIYVLSGSPNQGGGSQQNMEFYGEDNPVGEPSVASSFSAPNAVLIQAGSTGDIDLEVLNGNVGIIVSSMSITGPDSDNFQVNIGNLISSLLKPNSSHSITIEHVGSLPGETASLIINYGLDDILEIQLESNTTSPIVNITTPSNNQVFSAPADIQIIAEASDPNGSVISVEFFNGTVLIGTDNDGSNGWGIVWEGVSSGVYELTAVATDNDGASTTSSIISISVDNALPTVAITTPGNNDTFTAPA